MASWETRPPGCAAAPPRAGLPAWMLADSSWPCGGPLECQTPLLAWIVREGLHETACDEVSELGREAERRGAKAERNPRRCAAPFSQPAAQSTRACDDAGWRWPSESPQ